VYDLSNPYKADTMLYEVTPDGHEDLRLRIVHEIISRTHGVGYGEMV
jgi:hypothetical protein